MRKGGDDDEESMRTLPPNAALPPAVAWPSTVVIADVDSSPRSGPLRDQAAARLRSAEEEIRGIENLQRLISFSRKGMKKEEERGGVEAAFARSSLLAFPERETGAPLYGEGSEGARERLSLSLT